MCSGSSGTLGYLENLRPKVLDMIAENNDEEMAALYDVIGSIYQVVWNRNEMDILVSNEAVKEFYADICGALPRLHVTATAWAVLTQYKKCVKHQLEFLNEFYPNDYPAVAQEFQDLNTSEKDLAYWTAAYNTGWLYGREIDIVQLLTGVKKSADGKNIILQKRM